ncbi:hypothetical protein [[Eubacterium] cellulosolvens]
MGIDTAGGPSEAEKQRFLKKIAEWQELGFETDDLEFLLEHDFDEFLRRRHQILKQQLPAAEPRPSRELPGAEPEPKEPAEPVPELDSIPTEPVDEPIPPSDDELLLIGEPLVPEEEVEEEPMEEGLIVVGKPRRPPTAKIHRTRKEKPKKAAPIKEPEEVEEPEEDGLEEEEEPVRDEEFEEEEELEEEEVEEEEAARRVRRPPPSEKPAGTVGGRVLGAIIIIILISTVYYFTILNPIVDLNGGGGGGDGEGDGEVTAEFEITAEDGYYHGSKIILDASTSTGENLNFRWTLDNDFKILDGDIRSPQISGYYISKDNAVQTESVTLKVSNNKNENTITKQISLNPRTFHIYEEKLGDLGKYDVTGSLVMSNPEGIYKFQMGADEITLESVNIDFETKNQPMEMELIATDDVEDGFRQTHSVYNRAITQYLALNGTVRLKVKSSDIGFPLPPFDADLEGNMDSTDNSYTDFTTHNTIYGKATNTMNINILPVSGLGQEQFEGASFTMEDTLESYPDLRKNPMRFKVSDLDLADDELELGDSHAVTVGGILYHWDAKRVEYIYNKPAIEVNLSIGDDLMGKNNLLDFYTAFWLAENISQPVKMHVYTVQKQKGNTTVLNYVTEMSNFSPGVTRLASQSCPTSANGQHFFSRDPKGSYVPSSNWSFLPPTGNWSGGTSFDAFTHEEALVFAKSHQPFINYNATNAGSYIVSGYCTAAGDGGFAPGTRTWNLTLGRKDFKNALNIIISENGSVKSMDVTIDEPPNSTADFEPLLTFAGSEEILLNHSDKEFYELIFDSNNAIDFRNVNYGIETDLSYPNVDITSISFLERSKYSYLITTEQNTGDQQRTISVALDAETGQLLFYWDHTDSGFDIF